MGDSDVLAKPGLQVLETELAAFVELEKELIGFEVIEFQPRAVDAQECRGDGNGRALVPIDERVVLGKTLKQRSRLLDHVPVAAGLRSGQGSLEGGVVANSLRPPPNIASRRACAVSTSSREG